MKLKLKVNSTKFVSVEEELGYVEFDRTEFDYHIPSTHRNFIQKTHETSCKELHDA